MASSRLNHLAEYQRMHESYKRFPGTSLKAYVEAIGELVQEHDAYSLLDYGCGKGMQYLSARMHEQWRDDMPLPVCYDPGLPALAMKPEGVFDGVICSDVMEHIPEEDVDAVLRELIAYAQPGSGFVFLGIACRPAGKTFSNGENLHVTIRPPSWWRGRIAQAARAVGRERKGETVKIVAHFDVKGHFTEPEDVFAEWL